MLVNYEEKLNEIKQKTIDIANGLIQANEIIIDAFNTCEIEKFNEAKSCIKNVSNKTTDIDNSIITTLALYSPEARDLRKMVSYFKITNELLRASVNTRSFIKGFIEICNQVDMKIVKEYAIPMQKSTVEALKLAAQMFNICCENEIQENYSKVLIAENKTDDLYEIIENDILKQSKKIKEFDKYHKMLSALRKSEKIADRAMSIASLLLFAKIGGEIHQV